MTIAVIGATGNTGRAAVKELRALGQNPVCVVRNADKARDVLGVDAKTAVTELADRAALEKALAGVQSVFVVTGHSPSGHPVAFVRTAFNTQACGSHPRQPFDAFGHAPIIACRVGIRFHEGSPHQSIASLRDRRTSARFAN